MKKVYKSLPPHGNEAFPVTNAGEASKPLIIAIIAIVAVVALSLLLLFSEQLVGKAIAACVPPPSGLVSWWAGEDNAQDLIGQNHGSLQGGVTFAAGEVGKAFSLNGVDGYISIPHSDTLSLGKGQTVQAWVNPTMYSEGYISIRLVGKGAGGPNDNFGLYLTKSNFLSYSVGDGINTCTAVKWDATTSQLGAGWSHVVGTYDGANVKLYVNGALRTEAACTLTPKTSTSPVEIGRNPANLGPPANWYFTGLIDEVSILGRALSDTEIGALYNAGSSGMCKLAAAVCGNGKVEASETCDDGNTAGGEGCSSTCLVESGWSCTPGQLCTKLQCAPVPAGLMGWWNFESTAELGKDVSGNNYHATVTAGVPSAGKVGTAFDGAVSGGYLTTLQSVQPGTTDGLSVSAWVKSSNPNGYPGIWQFVSKYDAYILGTNTAGGNTVCFIVFNLVNNVGWYPPTYYSPSNTGCYAVQNPDQWHHFIGTYDYTSKNIKLYVDGMLVSVQPGPASVGADTGLVTFGTRENDPKTYSNQLSGYIDEVAIFSRALTDGGILVKLKASGEVGALFDSGSAGMCKLAAGCGNGKVEAGETCDDGNTANGDGCSSTCQAENGFTCTGQLSVCTANCGNSVLDLYETCDDGNVKDGDGCSSTTCLVESGWSCTQPDTIQIFAKGTVLKIPSTCTPPDIDKDGIGDNLDLCLNNGELNLVQATGCYYGDDDKSSCVSVVEYTIFKAKYKTKAGNVQSSLGTVDYGIYKDKFKKGLTRCP